MGANALQFVGGGYRAVGSALLGQQKAFQNAIKGMEQAFANYWAGLRKAIDNIWLGHFNANFTFLGGSAPSRSGGSGVEGFSYDENAPVTRGR
jgi:hypothetical protein